MHIATHSRRGRRRRRRRRRDEQGGAGAAAVWQAMGEVAAANQATVSESGVTLRFEAIRTGPDESVHHPLEPYRNRSDIKRQSRHWQQLMMFFVRTKQDHEWRSPAYKFNRRKNQAFQRFLVAARTKGSRAEGWTESEESDNAEGDSDEESDTECQSKDAGRTPSTRRLQSRLQQACLSFCIEMLNQTIHNSEYDMALFLGLAALGPVPVRRQRFRERRGTSRQRQHRQAKGRPLAPE